MSSNKKKLLKKSLQNASAFGETLLLIQYQFLYSWLLLLLLTLMSLPRLENPLNEHNIDEASKEVKRWINLWLSNQSTLNF